MLRIFHSLLFPEEVIRSLVTVILGTSTIRLADLYANILIKYRNPIKYFFVISGINNSCKEEILAQLLPIEHRVHALLSGYAIGTFSYSVNRYEHLTGDPGLRQPLLPTLAVQVITACWFS